jgi:hypothetical protein
MQLRISGADDRGPSDGANNAFVDVAAGKGRRGGAERSPVHWPETWPEPDTI